MFHFDKQLTYTHRVNGKDERDDIVVATCPGSAPSIVAVDCRQRRQSSKCLLM